MDKEVMVKKPEPKFKKGQIVIIKSLKNQPPFRILEVVWQDGWNYRWNQRNCASEYMLRELTPEESGYILPSSSPMKLIGQDQIDPFVHWQKNTYGDITLSECDVDILGLLQAQLAADRQTRDRKREELEAENEKLTTLCETYKCEANSELMINLTKASLSEIKNWLIKQHREYSEKLDRLKEYKHFKGMIVVRAKRNSFGKVIGHIDKLLAQEKG